ncbi:MAG: PLP-dependent aminotransferase family protein [Lachnospirales bacterium]
MLTYILDNNLDISLYEQLYNLIKNDIISGKIKANEKLPSKRKLASHLKLSIITVENSYSQLLSEGYIYSLERKGYFATKIDENILSEEKVTEIPEKEENTDKYTYEFRTNLVDTEYFPFSTWAKILREVLRDKDKDLLNKSKPKGIYELREQIAIFLRNYRGMSVSPKQIIVGSGSEYLINIIIQLLGKDKRYGVENPGYPKIPKILVANNINPNYIKLDNEGVIIDKLDNIDVLHITPSHQFPLGIVTPIKRRLELLQWAKDNNSYIIEDDYDSEFRYVGKPIPALQSLDKGNRVIYINTFTKNLAPALRISYMVLPYELLSVYESKFQFYSNTVSKFEQHTLAKFMENSHFERYINKMRLIYKTRLMTISNCINNTTLKDYVNIQGDNVGLHILLELKCHSEEEFIEIAKKCDIFLTPSSDYYYKSNYNKPAVILGYSGISKENIMKAFNMLEKEIGKEK